MSEEDRWSVTGLVVRGEQRGRLMGYPTANLQLAPDAPLPRDGIHAGLVRCSDDPVRRRAASISVGTNPTFAGLRRTVEAHVLDFHGDLYGRQLHVQAVHRLREMVRFPDLPALVHAITADVEATRLLITEAYPELVVSRPCDVPVQASVHDNG
jgi:riboflavin kinase/FMN adenylyltransferase